MDAALRWSPQRNSHVQRPDGKVMLHPVAAGPADRPPGMQVENDRQTQPVLLGPDIADVTRPFPVPTGCQGVPVQQVRCDVEAVVAVRGRLELPAASIHEDHMEAVTFKYLKCRNPINTGRFHSNAGDATGFEPRCQRMQILRECPKCAHGHVAGIRVHSRHVHGRADIDRGRIGVDHLQFRVVAGPALRYGISSVQAEVRGPCKFDIFLTGITAMASPLLSAQRPMCDVF